jgi:hypothetical protein
MITVTAPIDSYFVSDIPSGDLTLTLESDVDLTPYVANQVTIGVVDPDGANSILAIADLNVTEDGGTVTVSQPDIFSNGGAPVFNQAGIYRLFVIMADPVGNPVHLPSIFIAVEDNDGWTTMGSARQQWPDADMDPVPLLELLLVAKQQCIVYAPALELDAMVPVNYRKAQLVQARNIWNSSKVGSDGSNFNEEGGFIGVFPMDWQVKNLLRPVTAIPVV